MTQKQKIILASAILTLITLAVFVIYNLVSSGNISNVQNKISSVSSSYSQKTNSNFNTGDIVDNSQSPNSQITILSSKQKITENDEGDYSNFENGKPTSTSIETSSSSQNVEDPNNKDDEISEVLPPLQSVDVVANDKQKSLLNRFTTVDVNNLKQYAIYKMKDDSVILSIPNTAVLPETFQTKNTLIFEGDVSYGTNQNRIFILKNDFLAFTGDNVSNVFDFEYDGQTYWLTQYLDNLVISKPNFVDPQKVYPKEGFLVDIQKKNDAEFLALFTSKDPQDTITTKVLISPQKYFVDGTVLKDGVKPPEHEDD
jgi:hypothetical protein